jgi:class 3 adenylate cyclase
VDLREGLENAEGVSQYAVAVVADIRGFSDFSDDHESTDVATYVREVFIRLIDDYFPFATFYKSTGDGLMMMIHFNRDNILDLLKQTVEAAMRCVDEFPDITRNNPMISFDPPDEIGFGVTRGTTCRLMSGERILDYTGHIINLAARLNDFARPSGVVLDGQFGVNLLQEELRGQFQEAKAYIRGVAETEPHTIYLQRDRVQLPDYALRPFSGAAPKS